MPLKKIWASILVVSLGLDLNSIFISLEFYVIFVKKLKVSLVFLWNGNGVECKVRVSGG